jgi:thioredoxin-related protein
MGSVRLWLLGGALLAAASSLCGGEELTWSSDLAAAETLAAKEHKQILIEFTGSDWCGYCRMLDLQVVSTNQFEDFASRYILVRIDFLKFHPQDADEKQRNQSLVHTYKIEGFPTLVVMDAAGRERRRVVGYDPATDADAYVALFD